jgi:hypothetical protein
MTAPGFQVVTSDLRTHADVASQVADLLGQARNSGQQAALGDQAFGHIGVALLFSQLLRSAAGPAINLLAQAEATMTAISKNVSTVAANYDTVEHTNTSRFQPGTGTTTPIGQQPGLTALAKPTAKSGGNIVTDVTSLEKDIASGNWVQAGLAGMNIVSDVSKILSDPVGAILQYGLSFLMQAVKPLQQAVTWLVGNPSQVASFGNAWHGVSQSVGQAGTTFTNSVTANTASWSGQTADNYKAYAAGQANALTATTSATRTIGSVTQSIGTLVSNVQNLIKQMVSKAMSQIIQTALGASFMITIPVIVAKVVNDVVSWMKKIADVINQLTSSLRQLQPLVGNLTQLVSAVRQVMSSGSKPLAAIPAQSVPGITMPTPLAKILPTFATK